MSNLVLERWDGVGHAWREVAAAAISPSTAFNRYAFGNRFSAVFASRNPAYYSRLQLGFSGTAQNNQGTSTTRLRRNEGLADFSLDYGMPGKPGYEYDRPFDYFNFQGTVSSANGFENVMTRGASNELDYHYGLAPQILLSSRLIFADTGSFDITAREYYVSRVGAANDRGHDNIARLDASLTLRVWHQHAVALKLLYSRRDARFPDLGDRRQSRGTIGLFYTLLGQDRFGAVDWR